MFKAHVTTFSAPPLAILTESQRAIMKKERCRVLGLAGLQNPQVQASLKLTEEQSKSIADIQARRGPQYDMSNTRAMTTSVSTQECGKRSEEFHKPAMECVQKIRVFMDRQSEDIASVPSEEQRSALSAMTRYEFPRDRGIGVPAGTL